MALGSTSTYSVNNKPLPSPFVEVVDLQAHLALLDAFHALRKRIDGLSASANASFPNEKDARWAWFAALAIHRFTIWCATLEIDVDGMLGGEEALPPIDVLMVWHAYMLNSRSYAEDCKRLPVLRRLSQLDSTFFFSSEMSARWPGLLKYEESLVMKRTKYWVAAVKRPFDLVEDAIQAQRVPVLCPGCSRFSRTYLFTPSGNGYLQSNFTLKCPREECKLVPPVTHQILGLQRLVRDLTREEETFSQYLAGTLHTAQDQTDDMRARIIKQTILKSPMLRRDGARQSRRDWSAAIMRRHEYSLDRLLETLSSSLRQEDNDDNFRDTVFGKIKSAYSTGYIFSSDLQEAIIRQGRFLERIAEKRWYRPRSPVDKNEITILDHAIIRYHRFLTLLARSSTTCFVPTLDIQLAWHTHQLKGSRYNIACKRYVGRFIDYCDNDVADPIRESAFSLTSSVWEDLYDMPYSGFMGKNTESFTRKLLVPQHAHFLLISR